MNDECEMCDPYADRERHDDLILVPDSNAVKFDEYPVWKAQDDVPGKQRRLVLTLEVRSKTKHRKLSSSQRPIKKETKCNVLFYRKS